MKNKLLLTWGEISLRALKTSEVFVYPTSLPSFPYGYHSLHCRTRTLSYFTLTNQNKRMTNNFIFSQNNILFCTERDVRNMHTTCFLKSTNEPSSKVEETKKFLESEKETKEKLTKGEPSQNLEAASLVPHTAKRSIGKKIWDECLHYYHGFRLLFIDIKVSSKLAIRVLAGNDLSRREHKLLVRTVSDMFRLLPFLVVIAIPFMELALPILLKLFPNMLPSTFTTASEREAKFKKQLRVKIEMAKFLQETLDEMSVKAKGSESHSETAKEFAEFFEKIRTSGEEASNATILRFSKLFEDEITLDALSRPQLMALCRLLELKPIGTNNFLRFQLRNKIRSLRMDDKLILKEGIDSMSIEELQAASRSRGMRALGLPEERLRSQLNQWLELSLKENIPPSLLLLSRALFLPDKLPTATQLQVTLSSLSDTAATETKYKIGEMEGKVDNKTKLELIKKEEAEIKKEAEELKQHGERHKDDIIEKKIEIFDKDMIDKAPPLLDYADQIVSEKHEMQTKEKDLSKEDFDEIETALENIASEKKKLLIEKEEIEDLKEEMAEYKQDIEELKDTVLETGHKEIRESKAARRLSNKVDRMIRKMDNLVNKLNTDRENLLDQLDGKANESSAHKERDDIVTINEMVLAIRRIQKVSDDARLERIVDVLEKMDIDHDGSIEIDHVLKVIELLGEDNMKVSSKQMDDIIELLTKEGALDSDDKVKQKSAQDEDTPESETKKQPGN